MKIIIPYYGGKGNGKVNRFIRSHLPEHYKQIYVEPFAGMLGVLLNRPRVNTEVINDKDLNIVSFWRCVRDHSDEFARLVRNTPFSREEYMRQCDVISSGNNITELQRGLACYVVISQGLFNGLGSEKRHYGLRRGFNGRFPGQNDYANRIRLFKKRMTNVRLECNDAIKILQFYADSEDTVIYCDPPYRSASTKQYGVDDLDVDAFSEVLLACRGHVAISGYGDEWDRLGWNRHELRIKIQGNWPGMTSDHRDRTEVLWVNREEGNGPLFDAANA